MSSTPKIEGTAEAWDSGQLGRDMDHAEPAPRDLEKQIDDAMGMQAISIRLQKELIEDFKFIAKMQGIGYQPLMRDALKRFAESEYKRIAVQLHNEMEAAEKAAKDAATRKKAA